MMQQFALRRLHSLPCVLVASVALPLHEVLLARLLTDANDPLVDKLLDLERLLVPRHLRPGAAVESKPRRSGAPCTRERCTEPAARAIGPIACPYPR